MISLEQLKQLLPMQLLDELALKYNVNAKNQVKLPGQAVFFCLLNSMLNHPVLTLRLLEEQYRKLTGCICDHSSFGKRLSAIKVEYLEAICAHIYAKVSPMATKGDLMALKLRFIDATTVTLSSKLLSFGIEISTGGNRVLRHVKSVMEISDEGLPNLLHVCREQCENSDSNALGETMEKATIKGDLWIFDKGCNSRKRLFGIAQAGGFFLTPHHEQGLDVIETIFTAESDVLPDNPPGKDDDTCILHQVDHAVFKNDRDVPGLKSMHLVVLHCYRYDSRKKEWKPFVLLTNLPLSKCKTKAGSYAFVELLDLYKRRWEIEIFFKFIKQHLSFDHLTSRSENGIKVMIQMALITALLLIWYKNQTKIDRGWRSVKFWFADDARQWTEQSLNNMVVAGSP